MTCDVPRRMMWRVGRLSARMSAEEISGLGLIERVGKD